MTNEIDDIQKKVEEAKQKLQLAKINVNEYREKYLYALEELYYKIKYQKGNKAMQTLLNQELDEEPNLTIQEKQDLKGKIQENSGNWDELKEGLVKYGGKFVGHTLRSFVNLPDNK